MVYFKQCSNLITVNQAVYNSLYRKILQNRNLIFTFVISIQLILRQKFLQWKLSFMLNSYPTEQFMRIYILFLFLLTSRHDQIWVSRFNNAHQQYIYIYVLYFNHINIFIRCVNISLFYFLSYYYYFNISYIYSI